MKMNLFWQNNELEIKMNVSRCELLIATNLPKKNGERLSRQDIFNLGYMAGRCGINLDGNLNQDIKPVHTNDGVLININQCTQKYVEKNLKQAGIRYEVVV